MPARDVAESQQQPLMTLFRHLMHSTPLATRKLPTSPHAHQTPLTNCVAIKVAKVGRLPAGVSRSYTSAGGGLGQGQAK